MLQDLILHQNVIFVQPMHLYEGKPKDLYILLGLKEGVPHILPVLEEEPCMMYPP